MQQWHDDIAPTSKANSLSHPTHMAHKSSDCQEPGSAGTNTRPQGETCHHPRPWQKHARHEATGNLAKLTSGSPAQAIQFGSRLGRAANVRDWGSNRAANSANAGGVRLRDTPYAAAAQPGVE